MTRFEIGVWVAAAAAAIAVTMASVYGMLPLR
jgi:hypothetical protein